MKYARILFSPTGGTLRTAEAVTGVWPDEVETVDLTDPASIPRSFRREDLVLIAVPSFGGRVPSLAAQRLAGIEGNQAAKGGNGDEDQILPPEGAGDGGRVR